MFPLLFSDGKIFETRKRIFYSACVPEVLTIFTWNISIGPKVPGFCRWLVRNRSHFPDLKYNERHQVKIIWRHLKKRKGKKKKEKNTHFGKSKLFFFFPSPTHLLATKVPTHADRSPPHGCLRWWQLIHVFICISPDASSRIQYGLPLRQPTQPWQIRGAVRNSCPLTEFVQATQSCLKMLGGRI